MNFDICFPENDVRFKGTLTNKIYFNQHMYLVENPFSGKIKNHEPKGFLITYSFKKHNLANN
ncbi:hypothetical protein BpHYR1_052576 [Brachionus plicatilis]|uniref:Uncharacterized protein n=1 Tax=Brachionus plicatilis TaxID=10195 RepID=A0A3M7S5Y8_BRAPC|nr:hypothetical protein BpHYR1_052576 [Brachionus plicatilis]